MSLLKKTKEPTEYILEETMFKPTNCVQNKLQEEAENMFSTVIEQEKSSLKQIKYNTVDSNHNNMTDVLRRNKT